MCVRACVCVCVCVCSVSYRKRLPLSCKQLVEEALGRQFEALLGCGRYQDAAYFARTPAQARLVSKQMAQGPQDSPARTPVSHGGAGAELGRSTYAGGGALPNAYNGDPFGGGNDCPSLACNGGRGRAYNGCSSAVCNCGGVAVSAEQRRAGLLVQQQSTLETSPSQQIAPRLVQQHGVATPQQQNAVEMETPPQQHVVATPPQQHAVATPQQQHLVETPQQQYVVATPQQERVRYHLQMEQQPSLWYGPHSPQEQASLRYSPGSRSETTVSAQQQQQEARDGYERPGMSRAQQQQGWTSRSVPYTQQQEQHEAWVEYEIRRAQWLHYYTERGDLDNALNLCLTPHERARVLSVSHGAAPGLGSSR